MCFTIPKWMLFNFKPDQVIGGSEDPYVLRWYLLPRNPFFNIYLHKFLRSDDERALHDHPWANASLILWGSYWEHFPYHNSGLDTYKRLRMRGEFIIRGAEQAHRIELLHQWGNLLEEPVWSLFITGPKVREWGFHCKDRWVHWTIYTDYKKDGTGNKVGQGCD